MSDLIDRQEAVNALVRYSNDSDMPYEWHRGIDAAKEIISAVPSAEPEIIRCKDCKHYQFADNRAFGMPVKMCKWFGFEDVDDNDFCSRAERRTDD